MYIIHLKPDQPEVLPVRIDEGGGHKTGIKQSNENANFFNIFQAIGKSKETASAEITN